MPTGSPWIVEPAPSRSMMGSLRSKLSRKGSNASQRSNTSTHSQDTQPPAPSFRGPADLTPNNPTLRSRTPSPNPNPFSNASPATRRPDRPGMNAFTVPSNEPPPAYTASPTAASGPLFNAPAELASTTSPAYPYSPSSITAPASVAATTTSGEDPYSFLSTFDTVLLIDDSGSMAGRGWREVSQALGTIAPIVTQHDADGIDVYFMNHKSADAGVPSEGIAPSGYRGIKRSDTINEIFDRVRPQGGTPTGIRIHHILKPYLAKLEKDLAEGKDVKPMNLIVLTDGVPSDDVESVLLSAAKKLDKLDAPPFQVGVQFFQVGNEEGAKEALEELDDELSNLVEGGVRDMVDTVTWTRSISSSGESVGLTGDSVLKAVLGAVVKRLDRRRASGEARRPQRS